MVPTSRLFAKIHTVFAHIVDLDSGGAPGQGEVIMSKPSNNVCKTFNLSSLNKLSGHFCTFASVVDDHSRNEGKVVRNR